MIRKQRTPQQTQVNRTPEGAAQMNRDQQPTYRSVLARWRPSGRARMFRAFVIGLLACASLLGANTNSSHQARAAQATANVAAAAFYVTNVTVSVSPTSFNGTCSPTVPFTFTATFTFPAGNPGGQLQYNWVFGPSSIPNAPSQSTVFPYPTIAPGLTTYTTAASDQPVWNVPAANGNGVQGYGYVQVTGPNFMQSNLAYFTLTCNFTVTGVTLSTSGSCPNFWTGMTYTATVTIAPSPGGSLSYSWQRVTGGNVNSFNTTGSPRTITPGQTSLSLTLGPFYGFPTFPLPYVGTILVVTTPNMVYSNPVVRPC